MAKKKTSTVEAQRSDAMIVVDVPIESLTPDPKNARVHGERNLSAIANSLRRFGQKKPIVARKMPGGSLRVVAGNGTLDAAKSLGWKTIAATVSEMTDAEALAFGLADNKTAALAEWDYGILAEHLEELGGAEAELGELVLATGFADFEINPLVGSLDGEFRIDSGEGAEFHPNNRVLGGARTLHFDSRLWARVEAALAAIARHREPGKNARPEDLVAEALDAFASTLEPSAG